jgi:hypothetical protein
MADKVLLRVYANTLRLGIVHVIVRFFWSVHVYIIYSEPAILSYLTQSVRQLGAWVFAGNFVVLS